jgi:hypothetical protein
MHPRAIEHATQDLQRPAEFKVPLFGRWGRSIKATTRWLKCLDPSHSLKLGHNSTHFSMHRSQRTFCACALGSRSLDRSRYFEPHGAGKCHSATGVPDIDIARDDTRGCQQQNHSCASDRPPPERGELQSYSEGNSTPCTGAAHPHATLPDPDHGSSSGICVRAAGHRGKPSSFPAHQPCIAFRQCSSNNSAYAPGRVTSQ